MNPNNLNGQDPATNPSATPQPPAAGPIVSPSSPPETQASVIAPDTTPSAPPQQPATSGLDANPTPTAVSNQSPAVATPPLSPVQQPTVSQPANVPQVTQAAPTPYAAAPYTPVSANSSPKSNNLLKWLIPGAAVLLLIVLGAILAPKLLGVSQADYKKADEIAQEARTAYNKIGSTYISTSSTATEIKNETATLKSAYESFSSKFTELGDTKAAKRDKDISTLYKAAKDKKAKFDTAMSASLEMYEKVLPAVSEGLSSSSGGTEALSSMRRSLESVTGLKDVDNSAFVEKAATKLKEIEGLAAKVQEGRADYRKYDSNAVSAYYDAATELSNIIRDWQSTIEKKLDDGEMREEMSKLADKIFDKSLKK